MEISQEKCDHVSSITPEFSIFESEETPQELSEKEPSEDEKKKNDTGRI